MATFVDAAERAATSGIPLALYGLASSMQQMLNQLWRPAVTADL